MKRRLFLLYLVLCAGCASLPRKGVPPRFVASEYTTLAEFSKKYGSRYNFDTLDDMVTISTGTKEVRFLLGSPLAYINGEFIRLAAYPFYSQGIIYIPRDLERAVILKDPVRFQSPVTIKTIVVDSGHGGRDPGALSKKGLKEKDLNLSVAKYIQEALTEKGYTVILTRDDDTYLTLEKRVCIARDCKADLFISVHTNANPSRSLHGVEVYYLTPSRFNSEERAVTLAKEEGFWKDDLSFDARAILWDMLLSKNYSLSVELSQSLYFSFKNLGFRVKSPKRAPFYVLRLAYVPSVLVEIGYITNRYEEKTLQRASYQKQIAEAIVLGVEALNRQYSLAKK